MPATVPEGAIHPWKSRIAVVFAATSSTTEDAEIAAGCVVHPATTVAVEGIELVIFRLAAVHVVQLDPAMLTWKTLKEAAALEEITTRLK